MTCRFEKQTPSRGGRKDTDMKTIAILNLKGGTGKTVTAATMARCLSADHRKTVVMIDADQQGSLSQYFGVTDTSLCNTTCTLLMWDCKSWRSLVTKVGLNLYLIPADMDLALVDLPGGGVKLTAIEDLRTELAADNVDYLIIDLHPSLGVPTQAALIAADEVIIPIELNLSSTAGMAELTRQVDSMRAVNPRLRVAGVLGTKYNRTAGEREIHRLLTMESGLPVFQTLIRTSLLVPESFNDHESILTYSPRCAAAIDYRRWVREYLERSGV